MTKKKPSKGNNTFLPLVLLVAIILFWAAIFLTSPPSQYSITGEGTALFDYNELYEGCYLEYGFSKCIDGSLVTSFFNAGNRIITRASMYFYRGEDVDIYNCKEPLGIGISETLTTIACTYDMDTSKVKLEWCCDTDCYNTTMTNPSTELSLVQKV